MPEPTRRVLIIGAGPAGLMAADVLSAAGVGVEVVDAMPSPGRKFLRAGIGGLNLTHSEPADAFLSRYGEQQALVAPWLATFDAQSARDWAQSLGSETFVGSSGRVFPKEMKAAPLLRAWLQRLHQQGVRLQLRQRWQGWDAEGALVFATREGERKVSRGEMASPLGTASPHAGMASPLGTASSLGTAAVLLALGGGSWSRLGSDGAWLPLLGARGIACAPFKPSNCGFEVAWSEHLRTRFAGQPVKSVRASCQLADGSLIERSGELLISRHGLEGGLIYALSAPLRETILRDGTARLLLDLAPDRSLERLVSELSAARGRDSLANHLRRKAGIEGSKAALIHEVASPEQLSNMAALAGLIKALPLTLNATRPIDEAISTAGGVCAEELNEHLMLKKLPGVFCAGEMLDWEAPTGGYLLTACLASGVVAGKGIIDYVRSGKA